MLCSDGSFLYTNCFSAKPIITIVLRKKLEKEIQNLDKEFIESKVSTKY